MARPAWSPTSEERAQIELLAAIGYTHKQIAAVMGKSEDSLERHCRTELDGGRLKVDALVAGKLFEKCQAGDTTSLIFWTKTRLGWRETQNLDVSTSVTFIVERTRDR